MRSLLVGSAVASSVAGCSLLVPSDGLSGGDEVTRDASVAPLADATSPSDGGIVTVDGGDATGGTDAYRASIVANGPIAYFRFEESSGTICRNEIAGSPITCLYPPSNVTFGRPGAIGRCVRTDTDNAQLSVTGPTDFPDDVPFTVELWVKFEQTSASTAIFKQMANGAGLRTGSWLLTKSTGEAFSETWKEGEHNLYTFKSGPLPLDRFVHIALVHTDRDYLYVDGASGEGSILKPGVKRIATGVPMLVSGLIGCVDELAMYDKALTPADLAAHITARPQP